MSANKVMIAVLVVAIVAGGVFLLSRKADAKSGYSAPPPLDDKSGGVNRPGGLGTALTAACVGVATVKTGGIASPACTLVVPAVHAVGSIANTTLSLGDKALKPLGKPLSTGVKIATAPVWAPVKAVQLLGKLF